MRPAISLIGARTGRPPPAVADGLHRDGDAPGVEERPHEPGVHLQREEGEEDQAFPEVAVLLFCRSVDLDDELGVFVDAARLPDEYRAGLLVALVGDARRLACPGLDQHSVTCAGELVHGVRGERHPALARRDLPRHPDPHRGNSSPRASATAAAAASKKAVSSS